MSLLLAIDPGYERSAWVVVMPDGSPITFAIEGNRDVLGAVRHWQQRADVLAVECIASYGMAVGAEVFETAVWSGRFIEAWAHERGDDSVRRVYRREVKLHLCGSSRAKDANVRQALLDRYGPGREKAVGTKKAPGPLYGFRADLWAALGVAVTVLGRHDESDAVVEGERWAA